MKKYTNILFIVFFNLSIYAQQGCPPNEELRDVKCNGKITKTCVPSNYTCHICWKGEMENCSGSYGMASYDSYSEAIKDSERKKNDALKTNAEFGKCWVWTGNYNIYLDDSKLCPSNKADSSISVFSVNDFKQKFISLIDSWKFSISEAIARYKGYTGHSWPPELTQVTTEYAGNIQDGIKNCKELELFASNLTNYKLEEINQQFQNFNSKLKEFNDYQSSFQQENKNNSNSWIKLPDGTFYKKLPNGMYSFFDGIDQIETWSAKEGKEKVESYNKNTSSYSNNYNSTNSTNYNTSKPKSSNIPKQDYSELNAEIERLDNLIRQLKNLNDGSNTENIKILEKQLNLLKQEINK